ncbi:hypothetical protein VCV18_004112 [Metarhizium anisopliae]
MDDKSHIVAMAHEPFSRLSMASQPKMPPLVQGQIVTEYNDAVYNPGAIPKIPLRIPQRYSRRSVIVPPQLGSYVPSSSASTVTITSTGHLSPPLTPDSTIAELKEDMSTSEESGEADEKHWFAQRKRSRRFLAIVGVLTLVTMAALAVGLSLGLRNKVSTRGSPVKDNGNDSGPPLPVGAFSFQTSLQNIDANCTSKSTTWGCNPMTQDGPVIFHWNITQLNSYTYTITSTENSFGPSFANISMKVRDYRKLTERLEFSFLMNKTVTPSDAGSPTNRAARCTYKNVKFETTLYTRKRGTAAVDPPRNHVKYAAWPGDMEIVQLFNSTIGQAVCQDAMRHPIADVTIGLGACRCRYSNMMDSW